jgi:KDO2-lipid IV(A) lauroyltransferase
MDRLVYFCFLCFINLFRFLPFRLLYWFSDVVYLFIHYIACYRKQVVLSNLQNSFPDKSIGEIKLIAKQFYHHFSDILIESLKSFTYPEKMLSKRYRMINASFLDDFFAKGQSVICVTGHYANWEWGGVVSGNLLKHIPVGFYKPLSNKYIDKYVQRSRVTGRSKLAPITKTAETFETDFGGPVIFYMVADQSPSSTRLAYWVNFLNQDTATLHGPEKYARMYNMPVVFARTNIIKRGYYTVEFILLESDPSKTDPGVITTRFMQMLEKQIRSKPECYLWSHRRWKLRRT